MRNLSSRSGKLCVQRVNLLPGTELGGAHTAQEEHEERQRLHPKQDLGSRLDNAEDIPRSTWSYVWSLASLPCDFSNQKNEFSNVEIHMNMVRVRTFAFKKKEC